ncbi:hypothetical protein CI610_02516 [invertebrate metagenome]|uniref:Uncharacterized protein n=1 Tax=invertebrate metagenome TaxID=1711999 RepID=A0A2H9T5P8_9ZZZZ
MEGRCCLTKMSSYLEKHCKDLEYFCQAEPSIRKAILEKASKSFIYCLCECIQNILQGRLPLTPKQKKRLSRHKQKCRQLLKSPFKTKKRIIQQGGFLPAITSILLPLATQVLSGLFKR